ncbi:retrovirus-related pol polyprotein from transposon TNT 1-94 [Tanacetum coccineum]
MFETVPPIPPPLETNFGNACSPNRVDTIPTDTTNTTTTTNKDRFLVYLGGLEPYLLEKLENEPFVPMSPLSTPTNPLTKPQKQWSSEDKKLINQDKRLKSIIISCLPNDVLKVVIKCTTAQSMWNDLILAHEGPSDTRDTKTTALRLKSNAFKALEGEKVNGTFTRLKCLLNDLKNKGVTIPQAEASSSKALISNSHSRDSDSNVEEDSRSISEFLADLHAEFHERALLANQKRFYKRSRRVGSAKKPMDKSNETCFACGKQGHFQKDCPSNKTSTLSYPSTNKPYKKPEFHTNSTSQHNQNVGNSQQDYRVKYKGLKAKIFVLTKKIDAMSKGKSEKGAFMTIAEDEPSVGKDDARSGQWVEITMKKVPGNIVRALGGRGKKKDTISLKEVLFSKAAKSTSENVPEITSNSESECDNLEPLPPLPKLIRAELIGTSADVLTLADLTLTPTVSEEVKKASNKRLVIKLLLTLMEEVKGLKEQIKTPLDNYASVSQTGSSKSVKGKQKTWFGPCIVDSIIITLMSVSTTLCVTSVVALLVKPLTMLRNLPPITGNQGLPISDPLKSVFTKETNLFQNVCAGLLKEICPKVVFRDNSSGDTERYGSVNYNGITFTRVAYVNGSNACFFAKASLSINSLWHKRLSHLNFKNINKLAKQLLIAGLPSLTFSKDITCSVYEYSRYTWVFYLKKKSDAADCIMSFIRKIENLNEVRVKELRSENKTEFRNHKLEEFCKERGISQNFSSPCTPKQNGVAERRNRTLIEAARTMLNSINLPKQFWGESVNTACYTQNRSIIVKRRGRQPMMCSEEDLSTLATSMCLVVLCTFTIIETTWVNLMLKLMMDSFLVTLQWPKHSRYSTSEDKKWKKSTMLHSVKMMKQSPNQAQRVIISTSMKTDPSMMMNSVYRGTKCLNALATMITFLMFQHLIPFSTNITIPENVTSSDTPIPQDLNSPDEHPEFTTDDDHTIPNDEDDSELVEDLGLAKDQVSIINEPTSRAEPSPTNISPSAEVFISPPVPQDRWSREKYIELVNILGKPQKLIEALEEEGWIIAMQEELNQFKRNKGFNQQEGINYDEEFAPVARLEAIRIFLAYAAYMGFMVYQMDLKSAFLNGKILEEVYVQQPPGFESLSYLKGSGFDLKAYSDSDYAGCNLDRKSTSRGCCAQVLWIKSQLDNYDVLYDKGPYFKSYVSTSLTKQPSAYYSKYLWEFWYTAEADTTMNTITFTLSSFNKTLSFNLDDFSTIIGLKRSENFVPLPPKETTRVALATLGLVDENDTSISYTDLINSSLLKMRYFSPTWRVLMKEENRIFATQDFLSLIIEHLLGDAYKNVKLKTFKLHHIFATSITPFENEVPLAAHMCKVANLSPKPIKSLSTLGKFITPNVDPENSRLYKDLEHHAHESQTSECMYLTQPQGLQNYNLKSPKVRESGIKSLGDVLLDEFGRADANLAANEIPFDTNSKIKFIGKEVPTFKYDDSQTNDDRIEITMIDSSKDVEAKEDDSDLESMPGDEIESLSGFKVVVTDDDDTQSKHKEESYKADEAAADNVLDELLDKHALADKPPQSDPLGHHLVDFSSLVATIQNLESSLSQKIDDKIEESVPRMVADALEERLPKMLSDTLKFVLLDLLLSSLSRPCPDTVTRSLTSSMDRSRWRRFMPVTPSPRSVNNTSLWIWCRLREKALPKFDKRVKKTLKAQVPDLILKPLNKELNVLNTLENNKIVDLQKKPTKAIKTTIGKYLVNLIRDLLILIDSASTSAKAAPEGEKMSTQKNKESKITGEQSSEQAPLITTALVVQTSEVEPPVKKVKSLEEEPSVKKVKFYVPDFTIPSPQPLNSIMPQGIRPPIIIYNIPCYQYTTNLFSSCSFEFSLTPPLIVADKGKGIAIEEDPVKQLMPLMDE